MTEHVEYMKIYLAELSTDVQLQIYNSDWDKFFIKQHEK